jgi:hypothetical protein
MERRPSWPVRARPRRCWAQGLVLGTSKEKIDQMK